MEHAVRDTGRGVDSVRGMMAAGRTGCLHVHVPGRGAARLYLLEGDVIAAVSPTDPDLMLNRAIARGKMPASAGSVDQRPSIAQLEQALGPERVSRMMAGLFRNNLIYFLFDGGRFKFEPMETVRIPHIQLGHDSSGLLRELEVVHGRISSLLDSRTLHHVSSGDRAPASPQQRHIQALCSSGMTLPQVLKLSPFFPAQTLMLIVQMKEQGTLVLSKMESVDGPLQGAVEHAIEMAQADAQRRSSARSSSMSMTAFADHERAGRGDGEGSFTGEGDRVDLNEAANRRPGFRAHAPTIENTEVVRRVGVCNEVLQAFVETWDDQHGVGDGRRCAQLVVDTAPPDCAALFTGIELDVRGRMSATKLLDNLMRKPEAQRRILAQRGFSDLIDRTLARGAEDLDDAHVDRMLDRVAGYRQRLGW